MGNDTDGTPDVPGIARRDVLKGSLIGGGALLGAPLLAGATNDPAAAGLVVAGPELEKAIREMAAELGDEAVIRSGSELQGFRDPYIYRGWNQHQPSAAVLPRSLEDIQAVLRIANRHRVPLWTSSQGRNFGYGGAAPALNGSVVLNLRRMNRVLEINEESAYAVVEPGVSFFDLYDALGRQTDHRLWMSVPDVGWGSVVGNTLEHGMGYTPFGDHAVTQCGMEVVLANGDVVRTGMGAIANGRSWHVFKKGFGPQIDSLFMQSNFGIVTKMGVWLMPRPETFMSCWVSASKDDDLGPLLDTLRPFMMDRTIANFPILGNVLGAASQMSTREQWYTKNEPMPDAVLDEIAAKTGLGRWSMRFALYGYEKVVDTHYAIVKAAFERIPGVTVAARKYAGHAAATAIHQADQVQAGIPGLDIMNMVKWRGGDRGAHLGFSPITRLTGTDAMEQSRLARRVTERHGHDYMCGMIVSPRSIAHICMLMFDSSDEAQTRSAYDACRELVKETGRIGFGEYRAHLQVMDLVADQYDFNDHACRRFNETLKDALDPNGILSPGKQGIWPRAMRGRRVT